MAGDEIGAEKGKGWQEHTDPLRGSIFCFYFPSFSPLTAPFTGCHLQPYTSPPGHTAGQAPSVRSWCSQQWMPFPPSAKCRQGLALLDGLWEGPRTSSQAQRGSEAQVQDPSLIWQGPLQPLLSMVPFTGLCKHDGNTDQF